MTVAEMIDILSKFPPEMEFAHRQYEVGYTPLSKEQIGLATYQGKTCVWYDEEGNLKFTTPA